MLVRCASCNKPVFVSGSAVSGGEAKIACKACKAELRVTAAGEVTLLSGGAPGTATSAAAQPPNVAAPPVPQIPSAAPPAKTTPATKATPAATPAPATAPAADFDLGLPPFGAATSEPAELTLPPSPEVTAVAPQPTAPSAPAQAPAASLAEPAGESPNESTMIVPRPRAGQPQAPIELAPADPAESMASVRGPDPASYALGLPEQAVPGADEVDAVPPRHLLRVGVAVAFVLLIGGVGAWLLGFVHVPGLKSPGSASALVANDKAPALAVDTSPAQQAPVEPTPAEPTPTPNPDSAAVEEPADEPADAGGAEEEEDGKGKKKKKGKLARTKPAKKPKKPAPERPAPATTGGTADDHYQKASDLLREKKVPGAIDELKKAIGQDNKHAKSFRLLGMAYTLLGKEKNAVDAFERFVKLDPGHKDIPKIKGIIAEYYKRNPK